MTQPAITPRLSPMLRLARQIAKSKGQNGTVENQELRSAGIDPNQARNRRHDANRDGRLQPQELAKFLAQRQGNQTITVNGRSHRIVNGRLQTREGGAAPGAKKIKKKAVPVGPETPMWRAHRYLEAALGRGREIDPAKFKAFYIKCFGENGDKNDKKISIYSTKFKEGLADLLGMTASQLEKCGLDAVFGNQDGKYGNDTIDRELFTLSCRHAMTFFMVRQQAMPNLGGLTGYLMVEDGIHIIDQQATIPLFLKHILPRILNKPFSRNRLAKYLQWARRAWIEDTPPGSSKRKNREKALNKLLTLLEKYKDKFNNETRVKFLAKLKGYPKLMRSLFTAYQVSFEKKMFYQPESIRFNLGSGPMGRQLSKQFTMGYLTNFILGNKAAIPKKNITAEMIHAEALKNKALFSTTGRPGGAAPVGR
jgi:hypothetical protein